MPEIIVETDYHRWALETADALQERRFSNVDWDRVAEEIHSLGKSEQHQLLSRVAQLMYHLLKIQYQPERNSGSWERTVRLQRRGITRILKEQPSLKAIPATSAFWEAAYDDAVSLAMPENLPMDILDKFPEECPFTTDILHS